MLFNLSKYFTSKAWWMSVVFYFTLALLIAAIFSYVIFTLKIFLQKKEIKNLDSNIAVYGSPEQKAYEQKLLDYRKLIDDFSEVLGRHKITSSIFAFIEDNALPSIWFSSFDMAETTGEMRLLGEAENMAALSQQVQVFEKDKEYIKGISVLSSQLSANGKIAFILNLALGSKIFTYQAPKIEGVQ